MTTLIILNQGPYGDERAYNGLRLALALTSVDGVSARVYLLADAVACAKAGQTTPEGYYDIGRMLKTLLSRGTEVGACGSCMDVRGYLDADLIEGVRRSSMTQLADWTVEADKVISF